MQKFSTQFIIKTDHHCFSGYFPGNPIVPGTMILEQVSLAWNKKGWKQDAQNKLTSFEFAKFINPLLGGVSCTINFVLIEPKTNKKSIIEKKLKAEFNVSADELIICKGKIVYA